MAKVCESSPLPYLLGATIVATAVAGYMGKIGKKTTAAAIGSLSLATLYVVLTAPRTDKNDAPCAFCNAKILNAQKFYEDDLVYVLYTHKPILPGHCLILPKRHVQFYHELTEEEISRIGKVTQMVHQAAIKVFGISPYLLLQKNDKEFGQSVPHVHFHYVPRKKGDGSSIKFIFNMYLSDIKNPITSIEMSEMTHKMKQAMASL